MKTYYLNVCVYQGCIKLEARNLKEARKETVSILKEYISENNPDFNSVEFTRLLTKLKRNAVITRIIRDESGEEKHGYAWYYIESYNRR